MRRSREPSEQVLARVVKRLAAGVPGLGPDAARAAVMKAEAHYRKALRELDTYLLAHPGALSSGSSDCPAGFVRLAHSLADMGYVVTLPRCAECGRSPRHLRSSPGGRRCARCWAAESAWRTCDRCGKPGRIAARRDEGVICYRCYQSDPSILEPCGSCGRAKRPVQRLGDGTPLCENCYDRPQEICSSCGQRRSVKAHRDDGPICDRCYTSPARVCGRCRRRRPIARRAGADGPDLCGGCYQ